MNKKIFKKEILNALDDRVLNLFILPTEKCNFRCTYCYEDFTVGRMPSTISNAIKKLIQNRFNDLQLLNISWFGGEPLLTKEIIYDISDYVLKNKPTTLNFVSNITTNGYLLDEMTFKKLIACNVNAFQISLDGDIDMHNKSRIFANGKPTFDKIWENILLMHNSDYQFELLIRVHFTIDNYEMLSPLIKRFNQTLSKDKRINFFFKSVERLGNKNDSNIKPLNDNEKVRIKSYLDNQILNKKQVFKVENPYVCYASKPNSLMIRANGRIGKCTVALYDDKNDIGYINKNGEVYINEKLNFWIKGLESMDAQSLACPLRRINENSKTSEE
jgi:uncharacterized protein